MKIRLKTNYWETLTPEKVDKLITIYLLWLIIIEVIMIKNQQITLSIINGIIVIITMTISITYNLYKRKQHEQEEE